MKSFSRSDKSTRIAWHSIGRDEPFNIHGADEEGHPVGRSNIVIRAFLGFDREANARTFVSIYRRSPRHRFRSVLNDRFIVAILPPHAIYDDVAIADTYDGTFPSMEAAKKYVAEWWLAVKGFPSDKLCRLHEDCREHPLLARECARSRS